MILESMSHRLDQHGAAEPAADAFGGNAAPRAEPLHGVDEMQHDAVAGGADGMAERDRTAIDIEPVAIDLTGCAVEAENLAAEFVVVPRGEAAQHLGGEGLVQLPGLDVFDGEVVAHEQ